MDIVVSDDAILDCKYSGTTLAVFLHTDPADLRPFAVAALVEPVAVD